MNSTSSAPRLAELLLAGPRGRRFLLQYALDSELTQYPVRSATSFGQAAAKAALRLDPNGSGGRALRRRSLLGWIDSMPEVPDVSATEVAERLGSVELLKPTPEALRATLMAAVDTARYWQEPDGEDHLAATPEMQPALQRVARHVAASPFTA